MNTANSNEQASSSSPAAAVASVPPGFLYWTPQIAAAMSLSGAPTPQVLAPPGAVPREVATSPFPLMLPMLPLPMMMMYAPSYRYFPTISSATAGVSTASFIAAAPAESSSESKQDDNSMPSPKNKKRPHKKKDEDEEWNPAAEQRILRQKKRQKTSEPEQKPKKKKKRGPPSGGTDKHFDKMHAKLLEFKAEHGHCRVPLTPKTPLGTWVATQRWNYRQLKKGERSTMNVERMMKLTDAGFVFNARNTEFVTWEERIEACKKFKAEHGHLRIPTSHPELGIWVSSMRSDYMRAKEGKQTPLTAERQAQLEELGFVWLVGNRQSKEHRFNKKTWDERVEEFKQYKATHGHPYVPQHLPEPKGLGTWVAEARKMYKRMMGGRESSMTAEKALQLTNLGFAWDASHIRRTPGNHDVDDEEDDGYRYTATF